MAPSLRITSVLICSVVGLCVAQIDPHYNVFLQANPSLKFQRSSSFGGSSYNKINSIFPDSSFNFQFPNDFGPSQRGFQYNQNPYGLPQATANQDQAALGCGTPPASCPKSRYRSYDGSCNNLQNPVWGTPNTRYARLLPAMYADGISTPPTAKSGNPLPGARTVSLVIYPDVQIEDPKWTLAAMQYGQIITHDMSMIAGSTQAQPHATKCCTDDGQLLELANSPEHCFPIILPADDPAHKQSNTKCMNFVRTITDRDRNCVGGNQPAEQLTAVNHYLDLSIVYGNTDQVNQQVREFQGGRLRVDRRNGQEWLPPAMNASGTCDLRSANEPCYMAGDTRVNQNPQLTILQIVLLREHNRLVGELGKINPHWDDETLFQEARRINIAQHQHISYYEWLPIFIGVQNSLRNKILYNTKGFVNDYSETVDPTILNEHSTAAFRFFHSLIAGHLDLVTEHRSSFGNIRMSDWFNRPVVLEQGNNFDDLSRGMVTQPELASDEYHDSEITQFLFRMGQPFGQDLKAICIQRNRDHGLASYNNMRAFCGLPKARSFQDFLDVMTKDNVQKLASLYESPEDVDLTVGGSLETIVPGTLSGPTFLCILTEQFYRTRAGDRFWYENGNPENGFTLEQLNEIRKSSISRLMCDNSHIQSIQPRGFERISHDNDVVPCQYIPAIDLNMWRDITGGASGGFHPTAGGIQDGYIYKK